MFILPSSNIFFDWAEWYLHSMRKLTIHKTLRSRGVSKLFTLKYYQIEEDKNRFVQSTIFSYLNVKILKRL